MNPENFNRVQALAQAKDYAVSQGSIASADDIVAIAVTFESYLNDN